MKRHVSVLSYWLLVLLFSASWITPTIAAEKAPTPARQELCSPGVYLSAPGDCDPVGPSAYLTRMATQGITFPLQPLAATRYSPDLLSVPYQYASMKEGAAPIYGSLDDAVSGKSPVRIMEAGRLKYISYIKVENVEGRLYFELRSGEWAAAESAVASRVSLPNRFKGGLVFQTTPMNSFGWIIPIEASVETKRTPGYAVQDYTGRKIPQYEVVQIYATQTVGKDVWYMVGPDEWLEQRRIGKVTPSVTPPAGVTNGRWVEVNLFEQTLAVYDQNRLVFATLIASGLEPFYTRPGLFQIKKKLESTPMYGAFASDRSDFYYLDDVPFTMYYDESRALHGAYWRYNLGYPQSHGCVNMTIGDAHWLFNWAQAGDWVYVWDPSGKTPTDPKFYSGGGAP